MNNKLKSFGIEELGNSMESINMKVMPIKGEGTPIMRINCEEYFECSHPNCPRIYPGDIKPMFATH